MSKSTLGSESRERLGLKSGLEALQASPEFHGPIEDLDGHHCNDHFAQIYESDRERFEAAVPFVRHGLDRGERVMYVVDESSEAEVEAALRDGGVDVDAALESGAFSFHTVQDTYLRDGEFSPDGMIDFYADTVDEATGEYTALRIVAETTWLQDDATTVEQFMEYEAKINELFADTDSLALCQYDRDGFPPEVIRDIVRSHPHLIYDGAACHNVYYTPPAEFFGEDVPAREVDRMLDTLHERTVAKATVADHKRFLRDLYEITASQDRGFEEKLDALFELGCEQFDLDFGFLNRVDADADRLEVEYASGDLPDYEVGDELPLSETYCAAAVDIEAAADIANPTEVGYDDRFVYEEFGVDGYLGTYVPVDGDADRALAFVPDGSYEKEFSEQDRTFIELMGQWVGYELERRQREDRLAALNTLARELMDAETATDVGEYIVDGAAELLDLPVTAVALYDDEEGVLRPTARTDEAERRLDVPSLVAVGGTPGWDAFVENEIRVVDSPGADGPSASATLTEVAVFPLDQHGVLLAGATSADGFGSADREFVETVAANASAALDRASREQQLQERESALQEQNEILERLSRVNDIIRTIDQGMVQASSRAEIKRVVCEELATSGPYEFAWVGEHDPVAETVTPTEWAGAEKGYLEGITITTDDRPESRGPTGRAVQTGEPQVVNDILDDSEYEPWRQEALNRGYHASISLPLRYEGSLYGVLNVYAGQPGVFDELEQAVLSEMADNVAYAINAVESKKALVSDEITEIEFSVTDPSFPFLELARETECTFSLESLVPLADGEFRAFATTRGAPAADVLAFAPRLPVDDLTLVTSEDEADEPTCLFEFVLREGSLCETVLEHGGRPHEIEVDDEAATVVVHLAADAEVREFVGTFQRAYPGAEPVAQRSRERQAKTFTGCRAALIDELTARQLEVLQTAYFSGYFEEPRTHTATDVADTMGISQPTLNSHLRAAHRKLCRQLFEEESVQI